MFLLVPAYPGSHGQKAVKRLCVCVCCNGNAEDRDKRRKYVLGSRTAKEQKLDILVRCC